MKKMIFLLFITITLISCGNTELYEKTDFFVNALDTEYESYGFGGYRYAQTTNDSLYAITPLGRIISVKIQKPVNMDVYEDLKKDLENHYKNDPRVKSVFINSGGVIIIDCRN